MKSRSEPIFSFIGLDTIKCLKFNISSLVIETPNRPLTNKMSQHNRINYNNYNNPLGFECRTTQVKGNSLIVTLPKTYADFLNINQGDMIKIQLLKDRRLLILQKVQLDLNQDDLVRAG